MDGDLTGISTYLYRIQALYAFNTYNSLSTDIDRKKFKEFIRDWNDRELNNL